jgi:hypothetical protein
MKPGDVKGCWTVISGPHLYKMFCRCKCGKEKLVSMYALADGRSRMCRECSDKERAGTLRPKMYPGETLEDMIGEGE